MDVTYGISQSHYGGFWRILPVLLFFYIMTYKIGVVNVSY